MRFAILVAAASGLALAASAASADTINFSQFGSTGTTLANAVFGTTVGGVDFEISGPGNGLIVEQEGDGWAGNFPDNNYLLFDNWTPGAITINFAAPLSNISKIGLEDNGYGAFSATLTAYNIDGLVIGSQTISANSADLPGTLPGFDFSAPGIYEVVITSTDDSQGAGLGSTLIASVPEPATWALMLVGFAGLGAALRANRRSAAIA
jgi:hypothetical protein